jgi:hypothetical protein
LQFLSLLTLEGANVQGQALGGFEPEPDGLLLAFGSADAAAHAFLKVHVCQPVDHVNSVKLAEPGAHSAADANILIHF